MEGKLVKYSRPAKGEEDFIFKVLEDRDNRVLVEWVCDWEIKPTFCYLKTEFVLL